MTQLKILRNVLILNHKKRREEEEKRKREEKKKRKEEEEKKRLEEKERKQQKEEEERRQEEEERKKQEEKETKNKRRKEEEKKRQEEEERKKQEEEKERKIKEGEYKAILEYNMWACAMLELEGEAEWSQEGPTLSNDIWKKFQLIPTPPRSPSHEAELRQVDLSSLALIEDLPSLELPSLIEDHDFGLALENIDLFPDHLAGCGGPVGTGGPGGVPCAHGTCTSCTQLALAGSELRHDCMWRGTCTAEAHMYHPRDLHHHHHHHNHRDSAAHLPELLMDTASALECAAGFTRLHDLDDDEDDDDDDTLDDMEVEDDLAARPDTPSESSETDTDEEEQEDEDPDDDEASAAPPAVHVDHSYHCPRAPSPLHAYAPALPHTPSESEDEIDVVSVGSPDSAYSSSSSRSTPPSTRVGGEKRKRGTAGGRTSGGDPTNIHLSSPTPAIPSTTTPALPTATATTTFVTTTGLKKVVKIRTSNLTTSTSKSSRHRRSSGTGGGAAASTTSPSKRRVTTTTTTTDSSSSSISSPAHHTSSTTVNNLRRTTTTTTTSSSSPHTTTSYTSKSVKRIRNHHSSSSSNHHNRKRRGNKGESDDPERRHLHNSLERMRRVDLRNAFEELRALVPGLCDKDKAPKVEILRRASEHCYSVTQRGRLLEQEKERQKRLQGELKRRLASLQRRV